MRKQFLIVGGSYAAVEAAALARDSGFIDDILIVSNEREPAYHRPPLSKAFIKQASDSSDPLRGPAFYQSRKIDLELGVSVVSVSAAKTALLSNGKQIRFDSLLLAVGAGARRLTCPGADLNHVLYLRTIEDARVLKAAAASAHDVVVVGGGFIGLEVASTLAQQNKRVTVIEATDRVLARVSSPEISDFVAQAHTQHGVTFLNGQALESLSGEGGRVREVRLTSGLALKADLVVVGIGSVAHLDLARQLGLTTDSGIVVDRHSRTSLDGVFAAGDCASHRSAANPAGIRLESVQNAIDQARVAGATVAGATASYDALPWFWSDQYDYKLQVAGLAAGVTERIAREGSGKDMSVFHFRDDACVCVESVNRPREHIAARRLLARGVTKRQLQEVGFDAAALLKQHPG